MKYTEELKMIKDNIDTSIKQYFKKIITNLKLD